MVAMATPLTQAMLGAFSLLEISCSTHSVWLGHKKEDKDRQTT
jgi:hypothetical protein